MAIFRNSLYVAPSRKGGELPFDAFGLLAHFSRSIEDVIELATTSRGVSTVAHCTIADADGHAVGFEICQGQVEIMEGRDGLYAHANHTVSPKFRRLEDEECRRAIEAGGSEHRDRRLYELMERDRGRLMPQIMLQDLSDHENYPRSICSHRARGYHTTASVIAEPTRGLLHVTRGSPCQNWPATYRL